MKTTYYKDNRLLAFLIVTIIYVLATVVAVISFNLLKFDLWLNILLADVIATIFVFIFSVAFNNASVYDPYWSVQPPVILIAVALKYGVNVSGVIVIIAVLIWAIRLTANWAYTFHSFNYQDWRYVMLKEKAGKFYPLINFIGIHLVPTLIVYAVTMPAVYVIVSKVSFNVISLIFIVVSLLAVTIQGVADCQMHKFKKSKVGGLIRVGLWKYSRHPNYLGEILNWWGIGFYAVTLFGGSWYFLIGAALNTLLFTFVSIPMADERQSKKEGYALYKKQTRALLPIYKKQ